MFRPNCLVLALNLCLSPALAEDFVFDQAAQPLSSAIETAARTAGIRLLYESDLAAGHQAPALHGHMSGEAALQELLRGSGLELVLTGPDTATVRPVGSSSNGAARGGTQIGEGTSIVLPSVSVSATRVHDPNGYTADRASVTKMGVPLHDIPASVQVVTHAVLRDRAVTQSSQLLDTVSGVQAEASYGGNHGMFFNLRGFTTHNSLRDGFRNSGNITARDVQNIARVEVFKGPAGILYGGLGALGAQINVVSKRPVDEDFGEVSLLAGEHNQWRPTFDVNQALGNGLSIRLNGAYETNDTFRDGGDFSSWSLAPALTWHREGTRVTLLTEFNNLHRDLFDFGLPNLPNYRELSRTRYFGVRPGDYTDLHGDFGRNKTQLVTAILKQELNSDWHLRAAAQYSHATQKSNQTFPNTFQHTGGNTLPFTTFLDGDEFARQYGVQIELHGRATTGGIGHQLLFGTEYNDLTHGFANTSTATLTLDLFDPTVHMPHGPINPPAPSGDNVGSGTDLGVYAQDLISLTPDLKLLAGLRLDQFKNETHSPGMTDNSADQTALSYQLGLLWDLDSATALFARAGRSHLPNITHGIDASVYNAEEGTQYEVGVKREFFDGRLNGTLALFHLTRSNILTSDPVNPNRQILAGEQSSRGLEIDLGGELTPGWRLVANYAYTYAKVEADTFFPVGDELSNVPRHSGSLWTTYAFGGDLQGFGIGGGVFAASSREAHLPNTYRLAGYARVDTVGYYDAGDWRIQLNVTNLFDAEYYTGGESGVFNYTLYPNQPRTAQLVLSYRL